MSASLAGAAPVLIGVATVLFVIATIAGLARFARRRERAVRREKLTAFSAALELTARGVWSGRDLGVVATGVDAAVFWTAIENASMERRRSPRAFRTPRSSCASPRRERSDASASAPLRPC